MTCPHPLLPLHAGLPYVTSHLARLSSVWEAQARYSRRCLYMHMQKGRQAACACRRVGMHAERGILGPYPGFGPDSIEPF